VGDVFCIKDFRKKLVKKAIMIMHMVMGPFVQVKIFKTASDEKALFVHSSA